SYWIYQHLGNLSPAELREDAVYARVRAAEDGSPVLREYAFEADRDVDGKRWSFHRDFGATRVLAIDCRAGRVLEEGRRLMVDDDEWGWIREHATGGVDHLFLAMSDPFLLAPGISDLQMWNEAVCAGAWGERAARIGEKIREAADLDHWASFPRAFARLEGLLAEVGSGKRGEAPATIVALGGDVHNAYLAEVAFQRGSGVTSRVYQAVCSPIRNPLPRSERWAQQFGASRAAALVGRALRRSAQVPAPRIRWRFLHGPSFENQIATLALTGRQARLTVEAPVERDGAPELQTVFAHELA
ncbi:MAG: alkaline phosphatase family protein, partial [Thermoleophilia bacterium]|nr:alkaline phosphatase family protein [Thermoleophilia bacterium]